MADYSNMREQVRRTTKSRDREQDPGHKKMLENQRTFYEAMAETDASQVPTAKVDEPILERSHAAND